MDELIKKIVEVLKDYRREDLNWIYITEINEAHVTKWINQFNDEDREFILEEFLHLLPASYLSKDHTLAILAKEFEVLRKDFGYESVENFLDETLFLDCQNPGKSQKIILGFIEDILKNNYGYTLADCGKKTVMNWVYLDDVMASGGNLKKDILDKIDAYGVDDFDKSGIRIIGSFIILHSWAVANVPFAIEQKLKIKLGKRLKFYRVASIDNNPRLQAYWNPSPVFNHVYPLKSNLGQEILDFVENAFERKYAMSKEEFAFRNPEHPKKEIFFSSTENRERYERILMEKGFEIMKKIEHLTAESLRPLGMTPPSYKTLGTGTHFFTWRNISNTCPLVFWWGSNDWYPLFPVKNRGVNGDIWD